MLSHKPSHDRTVLGYALVYNTGEKAREEGGGEEEGEEDDRKRSISFLRRCFEGGRDLDAVFFASLGLL